MDMQVRELGNKSRAKAGLVALLERRKKAPATLQGGDFTELWLQDHSQWGKWQGSNHTVHPHLQGPGLAHRMDAPACL